LIADNLGWFRDNRTNIEDLMKEKGKSIYKALTKEILEFVEKDENGDIKRKQMIPDEHYTL